MPKLSLKDQQMLALSQLLSSIASEASGDSNGFTIDEFLRIPAILIEINKRYLTPSNQLHKPQYKSSAILAEFRQLPKDNRFETLVARFIHLVKLYCQSRFDVVERDTPSILDIDATITCEILSILESRDLNKQDFVHIMCQDGLSLNVLVLGLTIQSKESEVVKSLWSEYLDLIDKHVGEKLPVYIALLQWCYQLYFPEAAEHVKPQDLWTLINHKHFNIENQYRECYLPWQIFKLSTVCAFYQDGDFKKSYHEAYPNMYAHQPSVYEIALNNMILSTYVAIYTNFQPIMAQTSLAFSDSFLQSFSEQKDVLAQEFEYEQDIILRVLIAFITTFQYQNPKTVLGLYELYLRLNEINRATLKLNLEKSLDGFVFRGVCLKSGARGRFDLYNTLSLYIHAADFSNENILREMHQFYRNLQEKEINYLQGEIPKHLDKFTHEYLLISNYKYLYIRNFINSPYVDYKSLLIKKVVIFFCLPEQATKLLKFHLNERYDAFLKIVRDELISSEDLQKICVNQSIGNYLEYVTDLAEIDFIDAMNLYDAIANKEKISHEHQLALRLMAFLIKFSDKDLVKFKSIEENQQQRLIRFALSYHESVISNSAFKGLSSLLLSMNSQDLIKVLRTGNYAHLYSEFTHEVFLKHQFITALELFQKSVSTKVISFKPHYREFKTGLYELCAFVTQWQVEPVKLSKKKSADVVKWRDQFLSSIGEIYNFKKQDEEQEARNILSAIEYLTKYLVEKPYGSFSYHLFLFENVIRTIPTTKDKIPYCNAFKALYPNQHISFSDEVMNIRPEKPKAIQKVQKEHKPEPKLMPKPQPVSVQTPAPKLITEQKTAPAPKPTPERKPAPKTKQKVQKKKSASPVAVPSTPVKTPLLFELNIDMLPETVRQLPEIIGQTVYLSGEAVFDLIKTHSTTSSRYRIICPNFSLDSLQNKLSQYPLVIDNGHIYLTLVKDNIRCDLELIPKLKSKSWDDKHLLQQDARVCPFPYYLCIKEGNSPVMAYGLKSVAGDVFELKYDTLMKIKAKKSHDINIPTPLSQISCIDMLDFWAHHSVYTVSQESLLMIQDSFRQLLQQTHLDAFIFERFQHLFDQHPAYFIRALEKSGVLGMCAIDFNGEAIINDDAIKDVLAIIPENQLTFNHFVLAITAGCILEEGELPAISKCLPIDMLTHLNGIKDAPADDLNTLKPLPDWVQHYLLNQDVIKTELHYLHRNKLPKNVKALIFNILSLDERLNIYLVGGAVVDLHLGIKPNDYDFVIVGISLDELSVQLKKMGITHTKIKAKNPIITVDIDGVGLDFTTKPSSLRYSDPEDDDIKGRLFNISALSVKIDKRTILYPIEGTFDFNQPLIKTTTDVKSLFIDNPWAILRLIYLKFKYPDVALDEEIINAWKDIDKNDIEIKAYDCVFNANFSRIVSRIPWDNIAEKLNEFGLLFLFNDMTVDEVNDALKIVPQDKHQPLHFLLAIIAYDIFVKKSQENKLALVILLGIPKEFRVVVKFLCSFYPKASPKDLFLGDAFDWLTEAYPQFMKKGSISYAANRHLIWAPDAKEPEALTCVNPNSSL